MFKICGDVISVNKQKTNKGKDITVFQVLSNGGNFSRLYEVVDYDNNERELAKKVEIPVKVFAYQSKSGNLGLNVVCV